MDIDTPHSASPTPTCKIAGCTEFVAFDRICAKHAGLIYVRERNRVGGTLAGLLPRASSEQIELLVTQLERLMQMMTRIAVTGHHFEMHAVTPPSPEDIEEAAEDTV